MESGLFEEVERFLVEEMNKKGVPGFSVAIVKDRDVVWTKGFGYADREKKVPAAPLPAVARKSRRFMSSPPATCLYTHRFIAQATEFSQAAWDMAEAVRQPAWVEAAVHPAAVIIAQTPSQPVVFCGRLQME